MRVRAVLVGLGCVAAALTAGCDTGEPGGTAVTPTPSSTVSPMSSTPATTSPAPTASSTSVIRVFDSEAMQKSVREILTEEYLVEDLRGVTCPSGKRVEVDSTFDCTVQISDDTKTVAITVTSEKGDYQVGMPGGS